MTLAQAKSVNIGDKILHSDGAKGQVLESGYCAFKVRWNDGLISIYNKKEEDAMKEIWADRPAEG